MARLQPVRALVLAMARPGAGQGPKHCVIVFRSTRQRDEAMFQETAAFFRVNNGDMWVQRYMPPL